MFRPQFLVIFRELVFFSMCAAYESAPDDEHSSARNM